MSRVPLLALGGLALLAALWGGLARLGWALPPLPAPLAGSHGALMLSGFFGTLVCLERAVALRQRWAFAAPALSGLSGLALAFGLPAAGARGLIVLASLGLAALSAVIVRRRRDLAQATIGLGALLWLAGAILWWLGRPFYAVAPWWCLFLVLTIAGERLELARIIALRRGARAVFVAGVGLCLAGLVLSLVNFGTGVRLAGAGLLWLGLWLGRYDIARRTIRQPGLTRFIAVSLLAGYVWLAVAGGLWLAWGDRFTAGPPYDAMLHSLLLGFVFSMIFGHAPLIIPAVAGLPVPYRPAFYVHAGLLHLSLAARLLGDLWAAGPLRQWGGLLNAAAILLFIGNTALAARSARARPPVHAAADSLVH
jgi:hypothetical protein